MDAPGHLADVFRVDGKADHPYRCVQHQSAQGRQRHRYQPEGTKVDDGSHPCVSTGPEDAGDVGDVKGLHRHHEDIHHAHGNGDGEGEVLQVEKGIEVGDEHRGQQHCHGGGYHHAQQEGDDEQAPTDGIDLLPGSALADALAHDNSGGPRQAEAGNSGKLVDIAHDGIGGQHFLGNEHMAHDDGHHGGAQAPEGLIHQDRGGVLGEAFHHGPAGAQHQGRPQGQPFGAQGIAVGQQKFHDPGGKGGCRRAGDAHGGRAEFAEDENIVEEGVQQHGSGKDNHAHEGVFRRALGAHIHGAGGIENVAHTHDLKVGGAQGDELVVVGDKAHYGFREEQHHHGDSG